MQVSLGPYVPGMTLPMPDAYDGPTLLEGSKARFAATAPPVARGVLRELRAFTRKFVRAHFVPIPANEDVSVERWLAENGTYSLKRKLELMEVWERSKRTVGKRDFDVKLFTKVESYPSCKHARGINSRTDVAKCYFGPFFHLIEEVVYKHPAFIKHVPVRERPGYILKMLGGFPGPYLETDYSQFEKHFTPAVMKALEMELYEYMLFNFPKVFRDIKRALTGINRCYANSFMLRVRGKRMSGEMCTSLGNGFSNLVLANFIAYKKGGTITGVVEGDDGLFHCTVPLTSSDFLECGFTIKMLEHDHLLQSSFCGLIMSRDLSTMTDPVSVLLSVGWTSSNLRMCGDVVLKGLLRAKALSLAYEHPNCPVLYKLAMVLLVRTEGVQPRFNSNWYEASLRNEIARFKDETRSLLQKGPSLGTRSDFARVFNIPVPVQLEVERELDQWHGGALDGPWVRYVCRGVHPDCRMYCSRYVRDYKVYRL